MKRIARILLASLSLAGIAPSAVAATLLERPSTVIYSGVVDYEIDREVGVAFAIGALDGGLDLFVSGVFDPGTDGANPRDVAILVADADGTQIVDAMGLDMVEFGPGSLALLLADVRGAAAAEFAGEGLLALFQDPAFPAATGVGTVELRRFDDLAVIPLPPAAPLLLGGLLSIAIMRRKGSPSA
ncbi:hypothetical protein [Rubrimonas sp.]|uniref:hypothetical protein n=1 Tax=Rubrimonas sp. TaxID=2036015 RepID=UPI002FDCB320